MSDEIREDKVRLERLEFLRSNGVNPYPSHTEERISVAEALSKPETTSVKIAGRLVAKREMGKISFSHIKDASGKMQIAFSEKELGKDSYKLFIKYFDLGDFLHVEGELFITHKGELTVLVKKYDLLSKALLPLPEKFHGLNDIETRYRQRYLDLIANDESMRIAKIRSLIVREIRNYFDSKGFFEVETPVLQTLYGGALAKPFTTHHNALDIPLYLRVAPELYLKRLIVGGFEKVYEIAKCFRNEGIDNNHNPEFTQVEFYWAYANYQDLMDLVEDLLPKIITTAGLPLKFKVGEDEVDFTPPYPRKTMRALIKEYAKIDIEEFPDQKSLYAKIKDLHIDGVDASTGYGKMVDEIYKTYARPKIINPVFMTDHPVELSPLAKRKTDDPRYVERLQLVCVGGNELCNGFSELNDPIDQESRFKEQERLSEAGDEESMPYDEDFVTALKHGMPPTAGLGMGIDRLIKLLLDTQNLKEVILFPTLKPENN
ncbi:MAG: lysine--tRNA ligase [Candidatus Magasanikbacteria bacterium RIFOXYD2_FULL_39_9]|uniref:Lysine--tRNA ligase n=1 Tax=Candidatus Magasanikbacteria bacterium RIFOXYD1_FULL_40_23 TaxID=1798705 RepID=A0A1F6PBG9_9BACT|nr:MAG: lysine--tRNA ligase [Candidatus Magasanikbacteria bacterium RIFOXYD2_FULL_39_9]OGH93304.1 MAG: lysine--tRNA ligase [Candidatus Magasanikbacteria bacterium RIFOXYD1_FULL_40_23]